MDGWWDGVFALYRVCSFHDPFQKVFVKFCSIKKYSSGGEGLIARSHQDENLKTSSMKPLVIF